MKFMRPTVFCWSVIPFYMLLKRITGTNIETFFVCLKIPNKMCLMEFKQCKLFERYKQKNIFVLINYYCSEKISLHAWKAVEGKITKLGCKIFCICTSWPRKSWKIKIFYINLAKLKYQKIYRDLFCLPWNFPQNRFYGIWTM